MYVPTTIILIDTMVFVVVKTSSLNEEVKRVCVSVSFPEYG